MGLVNIDLRALRKQNHEIREASIMRGNPTTQQPIRRMAALFLAPAMILYLILFIYPALRAFYISLFDWNGFTSSMKFIGLKNFQELFGDASFWNVAVKNSVRITFLGGAAIFAIAFLLCATLSTNIKGKKFFRALIFFPSVINPIAVAILWTFIYNNKWGLLNNLLGIFGIDPVVWMTPGRLFWAILVAMVWMWSGFYCVILLAALDRVPQSHIEAAQLAGASEWTIFFKIKIPMIWDVLITTLTLWGINSIKEFALLYAWGGGVDIPPADATNIAVRMYVTAFGKRVTIYRMGYSTAMGVLMFVGVALVVGLIAMIMKRDKIEY